MTGCKRSLHHPPPDFRIAKHVEIAAHRCPECLAAADPYRSQPRRHRIERQHVQ